MGPEMCEGSLSGARSSCVRGTDWEWWVREYYIDIVRLWRPGKYLYKKVKCPTTRDPIFNIFQTEIKSSNDLRPHQKQNQIHWSFCKELREDDINEMFYSKVNYEKPSSFQWLIRLTRNYVISENLWVWHIYITKVSPDQRYI